MGKVILVGMMMLGVLRAERQEVGLMLGWSQPLSRRLVSGESVELRRGMTVGANYAVRVVNWEKAALYVEVPFVATPQHAVVSRVGAVTRDVATLYVTPGVKLKLGKGRVVPYVVGGGGYALFEQSTARLDGRGNDAERLRSSGAVAFGGGVEWRVWRRFGVRGEVRDLVSGSPDWNRAVRGRVQQNVVVLGGIRWGWGRGD